MDERFECLQNRLETPAATEFVSPHTTSTTQVFSPAAFAALCPSLAVWSLVPHLANTCRGDLERRFSTIVLLIALYWTPWRRRHVFSVLLLLHERPSAFGS